MLISKNQLKPALVWLTFTLLIYSVAAIIYTYAQNIPNADDFDVFLGFLADYKSNPRLSSLFQKHGEHIVLPARLYALISLELFQVVNFRLAALSGVVFQIAAILLYVGIFPKHQQSALLIPIAALILTPAYTESTMWAAGVYQHVLSVLLIVAAVFFTKRSILFSIFFCVLAAMTQGNGVLAPLACFGIFLWEKEYKRASFFLVTFLLLLPIFLGSDTQFSSDVILYLLIFLGASISSNAEMAPWVGTALLTIAGVVLILNVGPTENRILMLIIILTAAANALARVRFGVDYAFLNSRYRLPSLLFIATVLASFSHYWIKFDRRWILVTGFCLFRFIIEFPNFIDESRLRSELLADSVKFQQICGTGLQYPSAEKATALLDWNFWDLPDLNLPPNELQTSVPDSSPSNISWHLENLCNNQNIFIARGYLITSNAEVLGLEFTKGDLHYFLKAEQRVRPDILRSQHMPGSGFFVAGALPSEEDYLISIIWSRAGKIYSQNVLHNWDPKRPIS